MRDNDSDYIRRGAVRRYLNDSYRFRLGLTDAQFMEICEAVYNIPKEDVRENIKGKWLEHENIYSGYLRCSRCGLIENKYITGNFCPMCGADMRSDSNE